MIEALKGNLDYYVLISGSYYPIKKNDFLYGLLNEGGEWKFEH
ncbi:hypothetical protein [Flavobacterium humidisoli]|nr:hypothetical protein [Flavobacterium humidisoli]